LPAARCTTQKGEIGKLEREAKKWRRARPWLLVAADRGRSLSKCELRVEHWSSEEASLSSSLSSGEMGQGREAARGSRRDARGKPDGDHINWAHFALGAVQCSAVQCVQSRASNSVRPMQIVRIFVTLFCGGKRALWACKTWYKRGQILPQRQAVGRGEQLGQK